MSATRALSRDNQKFPPRNFARPLNPSVVFEHGSAIITSLCGVRHTLIFISWLPCIIFRHWTFLFLNWTFRLLAYLPGALLLGRDMRVVIWSCSPLVRVLFPKEPRPFSSENRSRNPVPWLRTALHYRRLFWGSLDRSPVSQHSCGDLTYSILIFPIRILCSNIDNIGMQAFETLPHSAMWTLVCLFLCRTGPCSVSYVMASLADFDDRSLRVFLPRAGIS